MPFIFIELPPNVERRRRSDGSHRYYFRPRRNPPPNWPRVVPFPAFDDTGQQVSELEHPARFAAILEQWATKLNADLSKARCETSDKAVSRHSLPWVWEQYKRTDRFLTKAEATKKNYRQLARYIFDWSSHLRHPHVARYTYESVERFVNGWRDAPHQRRQVQRFLSLMFTHAKRHSLRADNPAADMGLSVPKSVVHIWTETEVELMVRVADAIGRSAMGTAILICHEIGLREEDVIALRAPENYDGGDFVFTTSKTNTPLIIPATVRLRARLEGQVVALHRLLLVTEHDGKPYRPDHFRHVFSDVRATAGAIMAVQALAHLVSMEAPDFVDVTKLVYRQLRHTAVVNLARAGCSIPEIAAITGHSMKTVNQILERYLPRDSVVARNAITKLENSRART